MILATIVLFTIGALGSTLGTLMIIEAVALDDKRELLHGAMFAVVGVAAWIGLGTLWAWT